jgi:hypothetical protein
MMKRKAARPHAGLALLFLGTFLGAVLVARWGAPVLAFASSPLSPLPTAVLEGPPAPEWPRVLGVGLVAVGAALVVAGAIWLLRAR